MTKRELRIYMEPKIMDALEAEAKRRIKENRIGEKVGAVIRDLLVASFVLSWGQVKKLNNGELRLIVRRGEEGVSI